MVSKDSIKTKPARTPRHKMPEQLPVKRINNFDEVNLGYDSGIAVAEAQRCLQCAKPLCVEGCPVNIDIPHFINLIKEQEFRESIRTIKDYNILPAICGRVCPQETQCEGKCVLGKKFDPYKHEVLLSQVSDKEEDVR